MFEDRHCINEIGRRSYNPNFQHHWEFLPADNLRFDRATIIGMSGSDTTNNKKANGFAKIIQNYLDLMFKTQDGKNAVDYVDIMGIKYTRPNHYYATTPVTPAFANQLTNALLALAVDEHGQKLPLSQARKNFSRITFFTYCYGKIVLNNLINRLNQKLARLGYSENEIVAINHACHEVSFAPRSTTENRIPSIQIISNNDTVNNIILSDMYSKEQLKALNGIVLHQDAPGYLYGKNHEAATAPSIQIISSHLLNVVRKTHPVFNDHNIRYVSRDHDWHLKTFELHGRTQFSFNADCVSQMIAWALCRCVENSLQNLAADKYLPNTYFNLLLPELQSIIDSYAPEKLAKPTASFLGLRQSQELKDGCRTVSEDKSVTPLATQNENILEQ